MATRQRTKTVGTLTHEEARRKNIPTAEYQSVMQKEEQNPIRVAYERRNRDLDPQLVWRGKDEQDWSDLVVHAPPLYIQEKVHPKVLIDDLLKQTREQREHEVGAQPDLFADFNGIPKGVDRTEFYRHEQNWSNRMILGDSLQVMASLAEREGLRGKVQCIYLDPPYGIKFNSNFQWSTTSRDVKDGNVEHITREPEQVKAFRDTWRDGIHSYLTYLRDRLTVARDLLADSGSIFVQIGDENVHRVRALMDEVFGDENFISLISFATTTGLTSQFVPSVNDYLIWFARSRGVLKYRKQLDPREIGDDRSSRYQRIELYDGTTRDFGAKNFDHTLYRGAFALSDLTSSHEYSLGREPIEFCGSTYIPGTRYWSTSPAGVRRLGFSGRLSPEKTRLRYKRFFEDYPAIPISNNWPDIGGVQSRLDQKIYVVQTSTSAVQRCILMTTDPGDLVLDPTCSSGTTAYVAEQWGRRWITIDTSRVALALARARIMGARYPYYLLADSPEGQLKDAEITRSAPSSQPTRGDIRQGFVYERVPHITLKSIANNAEIDVIWEQWQAKLEPLREALNTELQKSWQEWEIPREADARWSSQAKQLHTDWWQTRIARQKEIDASIAAKAEFEYLYDRPYDDKKRVRVAGPFTVESLSPHRVLGVDEDDELIDGIAESQDGYSEERGFVQMILEHLKTAGVQQAHKEDKITFTSLTPWPGDLVCAEGRFSSEQWPVASGQKEQSQGTNHKPLTTALRAAIFIGPEFGTVSRPDLVSAAREAGDADFDVLIACAFNYDAHSSEFDKLGRIPVLKARMNADLHMADDLKNTGKGNLFVIFGEPDIVVASEEWLVDSSGKRVAPYEIFKLVSGVNSLAEVNRLGREDLCDYARISRRGEVWDYITNAAGGDFHSSKHRGGAGAQHDWGVSTVAWHCAGLSGGTRNLPDIVRKIGVSHQSELRELAQRLRRDQQDASRDNEIARHSPLVTNHYSQVTLYGVDVFHPNTGEVRSDGPEGIACWFIDTDYNEESFFVRHAYFLGANDPYRSLKITLKAEINEDAWATLNSDTSRPFDKPRSGRIAVKVINHLGDEVMKVFRVR